MKEKNGHYSGLFHNPRPIKAVVYESMGRLVDGGFFKGAARMCAGVDGEVGRGQRYARALAALHTAASVAHWRANALNMRRLLDGLRRRVRAGGAFLGGEQGGIQVAGFALGAGAGGAAGG